ncbi:TadE/TadG family type IV pilus assembly protein [Sphingomonas sp. NPDC019816]|uniref:TadE/TadG family type IV pilus assembly protein n=1 Tax=unclassified Sphingomonas TaxID=196159 RepID=UPI00289A5CC4|nr:TadE/TadG family type IV pilus assembly protein [Sphingomonas sp.]
MRGRGLSSLIGDTRGVALVEFAIILPVMLLLYLGGVQLQDAMACKRKVTIMARGAADLIAQNTSGTMSSAEIGANLEAATQVMQPYAAAGAQIRVSEIWTDSRRRTWILWSQGRNTSKFARGTRVIVPSAMAIPGTTFLVAQVSYPYRPAIAFGTIGPMTLGDILWMVPRNTDQIDCPDC